MLETQRIQLKAWVPTAMSHMNPARGLEPMAMSHASLYQKAEEAITEC